MKVLKSYERSFVYGGETIDYHISYSHRKTMEISVYPDGSVSVKAPVCAEMSSIEKMIVKKARWIVKKIDYFKQFSPRTPERFYVSGESHLYLGKRYRLKVLKGDAEGVKLYRGVLQTTCGGEPCPDRVRNLLNEWYLERAQVQFKESLDRCMPRIRFFSSSRPHVSIKRMKTRWGSMSSRGNMSLNVNLIKAPRDCIDYVVIHELCHMKHHNHGPQFYRLLESIVPDWRKLKERLELSTV